YTIVLERVEAANGPNYRADRATLAVMDGGQIVTRMLPEKRQFPVARTETTETAIRTTGFSDLYAVLGEADGKGGWTVRLYYNPLAPWIWLGAVLMAAGGLVSLSDRRLRVGAPNRRVIAAGATAPAGD